jgi:hypothetical protein
MTDTSKRGARSAPGQTARPEQITVTIKMPSVQEVPVLYGNQIAVKTICTGQAAGSRVTW